MNRLQISLTQDQYDFLKSEAFVTGKSMAAVLRNLVDEAIETRRRQILAEDPIWQAVGVAQEIQGPTDVSGNVDKYLYGQAEYSARAPRLRLVAEEGNEYSTN